MSISLDVIVNNQIIKKYEEPDTLDTFVEGRKGSEYVLRVKNNDYNNRVKVVVSVDGLNVMTGDTNWEHAYSIGPNEILDIPGWRKNKDSVAKFVFSNLNSGYNQDTKSNIGVIGVMAFKEVYQKPVVINNYIHQYEHQYPYIKKYGMNNWSPLHVSGLYGSGIQATNTSALSVNSVGSASFSSARTESKKAVESFDMIQNSLSTGWGNEKEFKTYEDNTKFEDKPFETITLYYDSAKGLEKRGIKLNKSIKPKAFEGYEKDFGCPPPKVKLRKRGQK